MSYANAVKGSIHPITPDDLSSGQYGGAYVKLVDSKATTVTGGASIAGTQTRDLNTEVTDTGNHCTLNTSTGEFTLDAGTWYIKASSPSHETNSHKLFLYNVTNASYEIIGTSELALAAGNVTNRAFLCGEFTMFISKVFEIRHYTESAKSLSGLGVNTSDGTTEIYTIVELWKVK